jgi:hypothetical protein
MPAAAAIEPNASGCTTWASRLDAARRPMTRPRLERSLCSLSSCIPTGGLEP